VTHEAVFDYLINKPHTTVSQPFGEGVDVFKVNNKMFATFSLGTGNEKGTDGKMAGHYCINLKCDPNEALALRDIFGAVIAGYHMNKKLWNTVILDGSVPQGEIERMIDNSFLEVMKKMPKKDQQALQLYL
tara:strand:+ start:133 stop:525 length:393 start_codon:yes stop_codon:yes gene_type:complete